MVCFFEALAHFARDEETEFERNVPFQVAGALQNRQEIVAWNVLHRDKILSALLAQLVNLNHIRVLNVAGHFRLLNEHGDEGTTPGVLRQNLLNNDLLFKSIGTAQASAPYFSHAASPDLFDQGVFPKLFHR